MMTNWKISHYLLQVKKSLSNKWPKPFLYMCWAASNFQTRYVKKLTLPLLNFDRVVMEKDKKIHWRNWKSICLSKFSRAMGFRDTKNFNLAMLANQGWGLQMQEPTLVYSVLKERYFPNFEFVNAPIGSNPSYIWHTIRKSQTVIQKRLIWRIRDGSKISVKNECWIPYGTPRLVLACGNSY